MITTQEHRKIESRDLEKFDFERLKRRINYNTARFDTSKINLIRYQFDPDTGREGFWSYFRIGAEWIDEEQTEAIIVTPKIPQIDFIEMFMSCLLSTKSDEGFSEIYDIDFEAKPVRSAVLNSILSPLLVVRFLMSVKKITDRGLRKGYVDRAENLHKVKGRIDFRKNEIRNIRSGHKERVFCRYNEFSVDTPENRYLKRALRIASNMTELMSKHRSYSIVKGLCNRCLSAFDGISNSLEDFPIFTRNNKLFLEYNDAIRFARMIIRKQDMTNTCNQHSFSDFVPVFRINMALLFEHYVLAKLRAFYGSKGVIYQQKGTNNFYPDFLINCGDTKVIADAKYTELYENGSAKGDYVKQLCGYARDIEILRRLEIDCSNPESVPIVPCILIYPDVRNQNNAKFDLFRDKNKKTVKYYTTTVTIPTI